MENAAANPSHCHRCNKDISHRLAFSFKRRGSPAGDNLAALPSGLPGEIIKCSPCALLHAPMLKRSAIAGLVVGSILTLLNQGDTLLGGQWNNALYWKIPLTYCVPFLVATYGALVNSRR